MTPSPILWKLLSAPLRLLLQPWVCLSIALHGLLLLLPLPEPEPPAEVVQITELPSPSPSPVPTPTPAPSPSPVPTPTPTPPPPTPQAAPIPPTPRLAQSPPLVTPTPTPTATVTPTPTLTPPPTPTITPTPTPTATVTPTPTPTPTPDRFTTFPHVSGAATCANPGITSVPGDRCWQTPDSQWRTVSRTIQENLVAQGYALREIPLDDDTGKRIFEVSKPEEEPYYLNLISTAQGTVYLFTDERMTPEEMNAIAMQ